MPNPKHKPKSAAKHTSAEHGTWLSRMVRTTLTALPLTLLAGLLFLLPGTALLLATKDPGALSLPVAFTITYLTAFTGGMIASKLAGKESPFLCAGALGGILLLFFLLCSLLLPDTFAHKPLGGWAHLARVMLIPASVLGALFAAKRKKHRAAVRHRRK